MGLKSDFILKSLINDEFTRLYCGFIKLTSSCYTLKINYLAIKFLKWDPSVFYRFILSDYLFLEKYLAVRNLVLTNRLVAL